MKEKHLITKGDGGEIKKECKSPNLHSKKGVIKTMIHEDFYQLWRENKNQKEKLHIEKQNNKINQQYLDQYDHIVDKYLKLQKKHRKASNMIAGLKKIEEKYYNLINGFKHIDCETPKSHIEPISWTKSIIPSQEHFNKCEKAELIKDIDTVEDENAMIIYALQHTTIKQIHKQHFYTTKEKAKQKLEEMKEQFKKDYYEIIKVEQDEKVNEAFLNCFPTAEDYVNYYITEYVITELTVK